MSIPPNQFRRDHPWTRFVLLDSSAGPVPSQAKVTFCLCKSACDGTGPADESKRTKRVQGWSRLNWLGGILIIVSWHIHFNKVSMPLTPVCCFANYLQGLQLIMFCKTPHILG